MTAPRSDSETAAVCEEPPEEGSVLLRDKEGILPRAAALIHARHREKVSPPAPSSEIFQEHEGLKRRP